MLMNVLMLLLTTKVFVPKEAYATTLQVDTIVRASKVTVWEAGKHLAIVVS